MKKIFLLFLILGTGFWIMGSELKTYVYPSLIYDDGKCSFYRDCDSELSFLFYYQGDRPLHDVGTTSQLLLDLPAQLQLEQAVIMDGWKKPCKIYEQFKSEAIRSDGLDYRRYTLPLPQNAVQPMLKKPLPGGMFGGTCNNIMNLLIKPVGTLPAHFKINWVIKGKYTDSGSFPGFSVALPPQLTQQLRTQLRGLAPMPNLGYSDRMLSNRAAVYRRIGIDWVEAQLASGPNSGNRQLWEKAGFKFYGGGSLMHILITGDRAASPEIRDYLVGLDGKRAISTDPRAYHSRLWCPTAVITPGRYPWKLMQEAAGREIKQGAQEIDADFETHIWSHCFCPDCRSVFAKFSGITDKNLPPMELVKKYPLEWYKFRCEQTRKIYEQLKAANPEVRFGANTILHHFNNDLGDLKYGMCDFAEDPRLFGNTIDYILADTLVGGVYDPISVDVLRHTTGKPIVAVAGASYCVCYDVGCMPGRRMTADLTGDKYGFDRRAEMLKLSMLHLAASGAAGLRFDIEEAAIARSAGEAAALLARVENWYLDGKRDDDAVKISDLTTEPSPWLEDRSRVCGGVWRTLYNQYNGQVQYRVHRLGDTWLISLFNWDPYQNKNWHLRLTSPGPAALYLTDLSSDQTLKAGVNPQWTAAELQQGFKIQVPAAGLKLLALTPQPLKTNGSTSLTPQETTVAPYNQYAWYQGGQINLNEIVKNGLVRPLEQLKNYGGTKPVTGLPGNLTLPGNMTLPFVSDFKLPQAGLQIWCSREQEQLNSVDKYCFAALEFGKSTQQLELEVELRGTPGAAFGAALYTRNQNQVGARIQMLDWGKPLNAEFASMKWTIPATSLSEETRLMFYNVSKKGQIIIKQIKVNPISQ